MKKLLVSFLLLTSGLAFGKEVYDCDFTGPNYLLTFHDDQSITLKNNFKVYSCLRGSESLPGTEVDVNVFKCQSQNEKVTFFYGQINDTIFISKTLAGHGDIACKRIE